MPARHTINGKAFEYACLIGLQSQIKILSQGISPCIIEDAAFKNTKSCFVQLNAAHGDVLVKAGVILARRLLELEPHLVYPANGFLNEIVLSVQSDAAGARGDVRDILAVKIKTISKEGPWEIGISCKHNHRAVKHQRISPKIDIGQEWFKDFSADQEYHQRIEDVFANVSKLKEQGVVAWSEITDKDTLIYRPALEAVAGLIRRLFAVNGQFICRNFLHYLIGREDFYKVILDFNRNLLQLEAYNFNGSLNQPVDSFNPQSGAPTVNLPTRFFSVDFQEGSNNTLLIVMDEGWQVSMRVHNASTKIENSLKLDVNLVGVPPALFRESLSLS